MCGPVIQIAGVIDWKEAELLMACGVHYLGFPLRLTVNKEDLSEAEAGRIIRRLPDGFFGVLITYLREATAIAELCDQLECPIVQLHGAIPLDELRMLRETCPDLRVFKSLVVRAGQEERLIDMTKQYAPWVDAFITDTFDPSTGAEGATGKTHDWNISRRLVERSPKPVILAGGLHAENVGTAICTVCPAGVDAHTGVEGADGRKEAFKVRRFVEEAHRAFSNTGVHARSRESDAGSAVFSTPVSGL